MLERKDGVVEKISKNWEKEKKNQKEEEKEEEGRESQKKQDAMDKFI